MTTTDLPDTARRGGATTVVWMLSAVVVVVPYVAWVDGLAGPEWIDPYTVFPLLGVWAWSVMWVHYAYGTLRRVSPGLERSPIFDRISGYLVLALVLLHPGLLLLALWRDTGQAPPGSATNYVVDGRAVFVVMAAVALLAFLGFEVLLRLADRPAVQRNWRWVSLSQIAAMTLVFVHGLGVGRHLEGGWLRHYWVLLGALLVPCFAVIGRADWHAHRPRAPDIS